MDLIEAFFKVRREDLTIETLKDFISTHPEENLHMEFKSGQFFSYDHRVGISKEVSSFANSDGGILIIGVTEKKDKGKSFADKLDGVLISPKHSKESLENILISNISPPIDSVNITPLEENGMNVFVLEIPQSERAPHMASDNRYYKRLNFQSVPMEQYELEYYLLGRKKTPRLTAKFVLSSWKIQNDNLNFSMEILIRNLGRIMAKYVLLIIGLSGFSVISPIPPGFKVLKQDVEGTNLQYGPYANGVTPVIIMPSPSGQERWTTLGKLTLQIQNQAQGGSISYSMLHEELPETMGQILLDPNTIQALLNGDSFDRVPTNEKFLF